MVEDIPGEDQVSRHIDSPHKWRPEERQFIEANLFEFQRSTGEMESLVWRKYARSIDDVHALGCNRQREKREAGKTNWTYEGALTARVGAIRDIKTPEGHGFTVVHAPEEGDFHVHISFLAADGQQFHKGHKMNLKEWLRGVFSQLEPHVCVP